MPSGRTRKDTIVFEPIAPLTKSLYYCGNGFKTDHLTGLLSDHQRYAFVVMGGSGVSFHTLSGTHKVDLFRLNVSLPNKHRRGGQSQHRFERLRDECCADYVRRVGEKATSFFVDPKTNKPNVTGIILAGNSNFKNELFKSQHLDPRLKKIVVKIVDIQYGGRVGLAEAIHKSKDFLANFEVIQETKIISEFTSAITRGNEADKIPVYGVKEVMYAMENGALERLFVWDKLDIVRYVLRNKETGEQHVSFAHDSSELPSELLKSPGRWDTVSSSLLLDWIVENPGELKGVNFILISDQSEESSVFINGFSGIGGFLRYNIDIPSGLDDDDDYDEYDWAL